MYPSDLASLKNEFPLGRKHVHRVEHYFLSVLLVAVGTSAISKKKRTKRGHVLFGQDSFEDWIEVVEAENKEYPGVEGIGLDESITGTGTVALWAGQEQGLERGTST